MLDLTAHHKGILCAFSGFSLFAFCDVVYKYAGQYHTPLEIGFWTQLLALILLFSIAYLFKTPMRSKFPRLQLTRSALLAVTYYCFIYSYQHMTLAEVNTLFFTAPFFVALLSVLVLRETVGIHRILTICIGFSGVLVVLRPGFAEIDPPVFAMLLAAFSFAFASVLCRKIGSTEPPMAFTIYPTAFIMLAFGAFLPFQDYTHPSPEILGLLALGGAMESLAALLTAQAFVLIHAVTAMKLNYINIVWATILGYIFFGDIIDIWTITGAAIIIGSGLYLIHRENLNNKKAHVTPPKIV